MARSRRLSGAAGGEGQRGRRLLALATLLAVALGLAWGAGTAHAAQPIRQVGSIPAKGQAPAKFNNILHVPGEYPTIQAAVDAAHAGDLVLIAPGVYHEAVKVTTANITIRGEDRNGVVLDGQSRLSNGFTVMADNVIIENMTAHHYIGNGFFWTGHWPEYTLTGYRGSYLTAYDNGDYGIYAFGAVQGQFDHSYASGSPDSGFYIGQCYPCDAIITDSVSEYNALGYSGTNAGGNLILQNSEWAHNGAGILQNSLDTEKNPPEHGTTIIHNKVHDNGFDAVPSFPLEFPTFGVGIGMPGGDLNYIAYNEVWHNASYGILVSGIVDNNFYLASGNVVEHNTVRDSGIADLALAAPSGANNCFANNEAKTTLPPLLELTHACDTPLPLNGGGDIGITERLLARFLYAKGPNYHSIRWQDMPAPAPQANMPDVNAPPAGIFTVDFKIDHSNGALPARVGSGSPAMLQPLGFTGYSIVQILLGLYGNWSFFALYAVWLAVAFWELAQREDLARGKRLGWGALVLGVPILGSIIYYFAGGSKLSRNFRLALVIGAPVVLIAITVALMVIASYTLA